MPIPRKIVKIGGARYIAIPPAWLEYYEKKQGEPVKELLMELNNVIVLSVEQEKSDESIKEKGK